MKKFILVFLTLGIILSGFSQTRIKSDHPMKNKGVERLFYLSHDAPLTPSQKVNPTVSPYDKSIMEETQIGSTLYDLQTNSLTQNRIYKFDDGTISSVWTRGMNATAFADRGTGYNYFDGSSWGPEPIERIESDRTGWPSVAPLGENGEIVCAHVSGGSVEGLLINKRETKGTGDWEEFLLEGPEGHELIYWPRMITSGENHENIHIIVLTAPEGNGGTPYQGQDGALLYYRSTDGGETWDIEHQLFEELGSANYTAIRGDNYMWAESKNGVLAFMIADPWMDLVLMKSTDNGDTWEKTVVWENPYPLFNWDLTVTDTFYCPDNSGGLALDTDGMAHIVFGVGRVGHFEVGDTYSFFPYTDGVAYWNENMDSFSNGFHALDPWGHPESELVEDYNLIGWMQDVDGSGDIELLEELMSYRELGLSTMPDIAIDLSNMIYLVYASTTETFDNGTYNFKHIWFRASPDNGTTWGYQYDLTGDLLHIFDECIFPIIVGSNIEPGWGGNIEIQYNIDSDPGLAWSDDHAWQVNKIVYGKYDLITGLKPDIKSSFEVSQNYPNPFNSTSVIQVDLDKNATLSLEVVNLMGQHVFVLDKCEVNSGTHSFTIEASELPSGIYFYTVKANESTVTHKMIVE